MNEKFTTKTAVIYARYSSDSQTEQSIEGQLRVCKQYAENNDILIVNTYIDRAMTGTNDNRPDFQRMIRDSADKGFDYVIVYKLDRFSRDKFKTAIHKKTLKDNGVKLISATENIPDTPEGIILESLLEGMAEYYSAELSQKVKRGMNETRQKGNFTGGMIVFGYKVVNHKVVINEDQAEWVRYIFEQYANGVYVKDIIKHLTANGVLNRSKPFATNTLYHVLSNEKYTGVLRHGDEIFTNIYPQIVPTELFEKVREKTLKNKYGKRSTDTVYILRHKVNCGYCGQPISAECGTSKYGVKKRYYKCLGRKRGNGCEKSMIRKGILEDFVIENIVKALSDEKVLNALVKLLLKIQEDQLGGNSAYNRLCKELKQTENAINNLLNAIEQGGSTNSAMQRVRDLEKKQNELHRNILIEKAKITVKLTEDEIRQFYKKALNLEGQVLINYFVKEILLYDDKANIIFNSPISTSPEDNQGSSFCHKTVKMPVVVQNKPMPVLRDFELVLSV